MTPRLLAALAGVLCLFTALAQSPSTEVDPERMRALSEELRCLVCQNQSIAESQAPLAQDLREELERLLREGRTDQEIRAWMVERYGDFVLYRPPFKPTTWALWLGPLVMLLLGALLLRQMLRGRRSGPAPEPIDARRLQALLDDERKP